MEKIIVIGGPTASGKSKFALNLAQEFPSVIINADSQQVYAELPIISAQPTLSEQKIVPHKLYGFLKASEVCSVGVWIEAAKKEIDKALSEDKTPILVGGTGMYIKCLTEGMAEIPDIDEDLREETRALLEEIGNEEFHKILAEKDPETATRLEVGDSQRMVRAMEVIAQTGISISEFQKQPNKTFYPKEDFKKIFINPDREKLYANCNARFSKMLEEGALDEIAKFAKLNLSPELPSMKALGVPELLAHINGDISLEEATEKASGSTRRYAKRQLTWFRNQFEADEIIENTL